MIDGRIQVWNSGGGTQSTAIAVLIIQGKLPKPDIAVIADTERELRTTWEYMDTYTAPALAKIGVKMHRVKKSDYATVDLYRNDDLLIPAFTAPTGKFPTYCSNEWKKRVVQRFVNDEYDGTGYQFDNWIGISFDEPKRIRQELGKWQNRYPLFELKLMRHDCVKLVEKFGWPTPPKSSCWMCPNRKPVDWLVMKNELPDQYKKAVEFERQLWKRDEDVFLHQDRVPLPEAVGKGYATKDDGPDTTRCDSGYCFV